jgi:nucleotidyltransferase/DNA polymerase involved in DNA repair
MSDGYYHCARCGARKTTGGHTRPNQCCGDCIYTDAKYCARLMGVSVAMPLHEGPGTLRTELTEAEIEQRRIARNEYKRRRRAEGKRDAA